MSTIEASRHSDRGSVLPTLKGTQVGEGLSAAVASTAASHFFTMAAPPISDPGASRARSEATPGPGGLSGGGAIMPALQRFVSHTDNLSTMPSAATYGDLATAAPRDPLAATATSPPLAGPGPATLPSRTCAFENDFFRHFVRLVSDPERGLFPAAAPAAPAASPAAAAAAP